MEIEGLNDSKPSVGQEYANGEEAADQPVEGIPEKGRLFWLLLLSQAFCLVWVVINVLAFDIAWRLARPVSLGVVWAIQETARQSGLPVGDDHSLVGAALFMAFFFSTIVGFQWVAVRGSTLLLEGLPIPRQSWPFELAGLRLARLGVLGTVGLMTLLAASRSLSGIRRTVAVPQVRRLGGVLNVNLMTSVKQKRPDSHVTQIDLSMVRHQQM